MNSVRFYVRREPSITFFIFYFWWIFSLHWTTMTFGQLFSQFLGILIDIIWRFYTLAHAKYFYFWNLFVHNFIITELNLPWSKYILVDQSKALIRFLSFYPNGEFLLMQHFVFGFFFILYSNPESEVGRKWNNRKICYTIIPKKKSFKAGSVLNTPRYAGRKWKKILSSDHFIHGK